MSRFAPRPLVTLVFALLLVGLAFAQAQGGAANLAVRAVISYANLVTPELVAELQPSYTEDDDLAFAIVDRHVADGTVAPAVAAAIKLALTNGILPHEAFVIYLADVVNGADAAPESLAVAQAQLNLAGVSYPVADANGNVTDDTLTDALTQPVDTVLADSDNSYDDAITPTTSSR